MHGKLLADVEMRFGLIEQNNKIGITYLLLYESKESFAFLTSDCEK